MATITNSMHNLYTEWIDARVASGSIGTVTTVSNGSGTISAYAPSITGSVLNGICIDEPEPEPEPVFDNLGDYLIHKYNKEESV